MPGQRDNDLLARDIAAALENNARHASGSRSLLLAGAAIASLQPLAADALGLSELQVKSALGQPFVATATARTNSAETLSNGCITSAASSQGGMSSVSDLKVSVPETSSPGTHTIRLTSRQPLYEPMYEIRLQVNCPGGVSFARDYVVMLNLPLTSPRQQLKPEASQPQPAPARKAVTTTTANRPAPRPADTIRIAPAAVAQAPAEPAEMQPYTVRFATPTAPLQAGTEYRVQPGDTLSTIAQRIEERAPGTTYAVAATIFAANPNAFVNSDSNKIKLGSVIRLPAAAQLQAAPVATAATANSLVTAVPEPTTAELVTASTATPVAPAVQDAPANAQVVTTGSVAMTDSDNRLAADLPVPVAAGMLPIARELATAAVPAATNEELALAEADSTQPVAEDETIVVDSAMLDDPEFLAESADAGMEAASTTAALPLVDTAAPAETANSAAAESAVHPLLAAGLGVLLGCLLAALLLGRKLIARVWPARKAADPRLVIEELDAQSAAQPARNIDFQGVATDVRDETPELAEDELEATQPTPILTEAEMPAADLDATIDTPRISLKATTNVDFDLEADDLIDETAKFSAPAFSIDGEPQEASELDGTNTMRKLFSEEVEQRAAEADDDYALTAELAGLDDQTDLDRTSDLQSISEIMDSGTIDEKLSQTLTQALDLLQQDYEDEFSSSQILEQREVADAFSALKKH